MAKIPIYGTLSNETPEGKLAVAEQIFDETEGKNQREINAETIRTTEQTLEEAKKEQVKKNIGLPIYAYYNDTSAEERKKSGVSIDLRIFQEDSKNQVGNGSIAIGALNKNTGILSVTLGYQNVTSDGFGEGMGMMPGSFFFGSQLSDRDSDTFSAIGYRNNAVYKDGPVGKRVGSYLTISVPYPYEHEVYGMNLAVFGSDENLYIHGIGGYDGGSLNGEAPILAEHKSLQEVLKDLETRVPEAPKDGKSYVRIDGGWKESTELAFRALWEKVGGEYTVEDGYSYFGIKLTLEQAIYSYNYPLFSFAELANYAYPNIKNGTVIPPVLISKVPFIGAGWNSKRTFEGINTKNLILGNLSQTITIFNVSYRTFVSYYLEKIHNVLDFINRSEDVTDFFGANLQSVYIKNIKVNINIKTSGKINYESVKYLIDNAANDTAITVTVHPTTYSYLTGTAEPPEQVGGTTEEWQALVTTASEKQISFATAEN